MKHFTWRGIASLPMRSNAFAYPHRLVTSHTIDAES
jgi:hypothetical protein